MILKVSNDPKLHILIEGVAKYITISDINNIVKTFIDKVGYKEPEFSIKGNDIITNSKEFAWMIADF